MTKSLSRSSPVPLYYQLESMLRDDIAGGRIAPGGALPTEDALVRDFGVSRITVRRAMERLVQAGLIHRIPGRGTFVNTPTPHEFRIERNPADLMGFEADIRRHGFVPEARVLRREWIPAPPDVAAALDVISDTEVLWVSRVGTAQGRPLWTEDRYLARAWAARLRPRDLAVPGLLATTARARGVVVDRARLKIAARGATRGEARLLGLRPGAPVLTAEFAVQAGGRPAQFVRARFRPDRYGFVFTVTPETPPRTVGGAPTKPDGTQADPGGRS